jgi:hypothetical protein
MLRFILLFVLLVFFLKKGNKNEGFVQGKSIDAMFHATFKPECCPTPYSTSSGCLCPSPNDAGIIIKRGMVKHT